MWGCASANSDGFVVLLLVPAAVPGKKQANCVSDEVSALVFALVKSDGPVLITVGSGSRTVTAVSTEVAQVVLEALHQATIIVENDVLRLGNRVIQLNLVGSSDALSKLLALIVLLPKADGNNRPAAVLEARKPVVQRRASNDPVALLNPRQKASVGKRSGFRLS